MTPITPEARAEDRMLTAFGRAASTIAWSGSLQVVLDDLAHEIHEVSSADACALTLVSPFGSSVDLFGAAGYPEGYLDRIERAVALGAPLQALETYRSRLPSVRDVTDHLSSDPRFEPYVEMVEAMGWRTLVTVPLVVRDEAVGVLTALYTDDTQPRGREMAFLTAMADHGAMAVSAARLLGRARAKAVQDERTRMAREVHDAVSQSLFSMRLRVGALRSVADRAIDDSGKLAPGLLALEEVVESAVEDMRALVQHLRPDDLHGSDLAGAIRRYAEAVSDLETAPVEVRVPPDLPRLPHAVESEVYLVAREAVTNGLDHARARHVAVRLGPGCVDGRQVLLLEVVDDGVGFDVEADWPGHLGLVSMRERAEGIGAELLLQSGPAGTTIRLAVPLSAAERPAGSSHGSGEG